MEVLIRFSNGERPENVCPVNKMVGNNNRNVVIEALSLASHLNSINGQKLLGQWFAGGRSTHSTTYPML